MSKSSILRSSIALAIAAATFVSVQAQTPTPTPRYAPSPQASPTPQSSPSPQAKPGDPLKALQYRLIGPFRGGRVTAVAGVPSLPKVYYFGGTGGGVWKTTDGGINWQPMSDEYFKTGSVGAIAVSESDPNVVYVGMGESPLRGNITHGDGVYKSIDAGKTWKFVGLGDTRHIGKVRVNPKNPDVVFVAALGHTWGPNAERGVFRTKDGGKTWEKILFRNNDTGALDLAFDPSNANTIYATFWQVRRTPWSLSSGGDGSTMYKSIDGGDTWTELKGNKGLPSGVWGKVCITVSPVNTNRVWAMVEAKDGGLYRSDDAGDTWQRVSESANIRQRPWYFSRVFADTQQLDTVYVLNVQLNKSVDGGRTFTTVGTPHSDNHDLWIAPNDNQRMIEGNDGGANVSEDSGRNWTEQDQPTAQFYRVITDNDFPYNIYGAQQDNSTVRIASRSDGFGITEREWFDVGGGESGWIAPYPDNSEIIFAGSYGGYISRYDHRTGQMRDVNAYPENPMGSGAGAIKYRFQWNFPIVFSPHKVNGVYPLYSAAQVLFRSMDQGQSWEAISPDLTRNDKSKQASSGGQLTQDNTSIEYYDTIFTVAESPVEQGVIWAGTDDGLVQVTRDNGKTWQNVTPKGLPEWIQVNSIEASPNDAGTAYFAATAYKLEDLRPYIYKTSDYGKTWKKITDGIPDGSYSRVVREDPNRRGFLYAGTETGVFYSPNDGDSWQSLRLNLPSVPVHDLAVQKRDRDLVVATHGRAFYVLDNLNVLYQLADAQKADAFLFKPEDAYRTAGGGGFQLPATATVGANPPSGAVINYWLKSKPSKDITIEFLDSAGKSLRKYTGRVQAEGGSQQGEGGGGGFGGRGGEPPVTMDAGLNRFVWNYRLPNATTVPGMIFWGGSTAGPRVVPGEYQVRLTVDGKTIGTENFSVKADPRLETTPQQYAEQYDFLLKSRDKLSQTHDAILEIRDMRKQLEDLSSRLKPEQKEIKDKAAEIVKSLTAVEEELVQTKIRSGQDALNFPIKLNNKLAALNSAVDSGDYAPTKQSYDVYNDLTTKIDAQLARFNEIKANDIAAFNKMYAEKGLPVVSPKGK